MWYVTCNKIQLACMWCSVIAFSLHDCQDINNGMLVALLNFQIHQVGTWKCWINTLYILVLHKSITILHISIHFKKKSIFLFLSWLVVFYHLPRPQPLIQCQVHKHGIDPSLASLPWNLLTLCGPNTYPCTSHNSTLYFPMINMSSPHFFISIGWPINNLLLHSGIHFHDH
jgi:hypothetical protein